MQWFAFSVKPISGINQATQKKVKSDLKIFIKILLTKPLVKMPYIILYSVVEVGRVTVGRFHQHFMNSISNNSLKLILLAYCVERRA
jgi:hypothetical protein